MRWDVLCIDLRDISSDRLIAEVGAVRPLRVLVPLAREYALATDLLEAEAHAADAGEEVDESEFHSNSVVAGPDGLTS